MNYKKIAYQLIAEKAKELYKAGKKMTCEELRLWLNQQLPSDCQYGSLRSVFKAAWKRTDDFGKEAMEMSFINSHGFPLLR